MKKIYELKDEELEQVNGGDGGAIADPCSEIDDFIPQEYNLILKSAGPNKFKTVKIIHDLTNYTTVQAKTIAECLPFTILEAVSLERAQQAYNQFSAVGAICEIV